MKKIVGSLLAISLVVVMTSLAQAALCQPDQGCVKVDIGVVPDPVCQGGSITVTGYIQNCATDCHDLFRVWVKFGILGDVNANFPGKIRCIRPSMIVIPLGPNGEFEFTYRSKIPVIVPAGEYSITIYARGMRSGVEAEKTVSFTVEPCTTP